MGALYARPLPLRLAAQIIPAFPGNRWAAARHGAPGTAQRDRQGRARSTKPGGTLYERRFPGNESRRSYGNGAAYPWKHWTVGIPDRARDGGARETGLYQSRARTGFGRRFG
jgi:hypothetical protein